MEGKMEIPWGWGVSKAKILKRKVWGLAGISRGVGWGGIQTKKTFCGRGMDIFWNNTLETKHIRNKQRNVYNLEMEVLFGLIVQVKKR